MRHHEINLFSWDSDTKTSRLENLLSVLKTPVPDPFRERFLFVGCSANVHSWLDYMSDLKYELYCDNIVSPFEGRLEFVNGLGLLSDEELPTVFERLQNAMFKLGGLQLAKRESIRIGESLLVAGSDVKVYEQVLMDTLSGLSYLTA